MHALNRSFNGEKMRERERKAKGKEKSKKKRIYDCIGVKWDNTDRSKANVVYTVQLVCILSFSSMYLTS